MQHNEAPLFANRADAGRALAARLGRYARRDDVVVLGLPRGGVVVAAEVAIALDAQLDVVLVRKLGVPGHEEFAMGAIANGSVLERNAASLAAAGVSESELLRVMERERTELTRQDRVFRRGRRAADLAGRIVIVVDDGLATGSTMRAAVSALRDRDVGRIVVAAPVAARQALEGVARLADEVVCIAEPEPFVSVGAWYEDFGQTEDAEVIACLDRVARARSEFAESARRKDGSR